MQRVNNMRYMTAGLQQTPGERMHGRSGVSLPDSEAGRQYDDRGRRPYHAEHAVKRPRFGGEMSLKKAAALLAVLTVLFGVLTGVRWVRRDRLIRSIREMKIQIQADEDENEKLAAQVEEARGFLRISDLATQNYGMFDSRLVAAQMVIAPSTRPGDQQTALQAGAAPLSLLDGMTTGSR